MSGTLTTVNCTSCGAGLDVLGGGRVKTHVCPYCAAALDAQDDYKVVARYRDLPRPDSPFRIGATGQIDGVEFTVIGTMEWTERWKSDVWTWVDHQVYSPTHGYGWLTWEDDHVTYSRKVRGSTNPGDLTPAMVEQADYRPSVYFSGRGQYRYYSSGTAHCSFVEGEFNYAPRIDDQISYVDLVGADTILTMSYSGQEKELELTRLLPRDETLASFGAEPTDTPVGVHPLDHYDPSPLPAFARNVALVSAVVALVIGFVLLQMATPVVRAETLSLGGLRSLVGTPTLPFSITAPRGLTRIEIDAPVDNAWAWFEVELFDAEETPVAAWEGIAESYSGVDWSEGTGRLVRNVALPPGDYVLEVAQTETGTYADGRPPSGDIRVSVSQGVAAFRWMWFAAAGFVVLGAVVFDQYTSRSRKKHRDRRWAGSDWSDD